jgi:hypothetical protein
MKSGSEAKVAGANNPNSMKNGEKPAAGKGASDIKSASGLKATSDLKSMDKAAPSKATTGKGGSDIKAVDKTMKH